MWTTGSHPAWGQGTVSWVSAAQAWQACRRGAAQRPSLPPIMGAATGLGPGAPHTRRFRFRLPTRLRECVAGDDAEELESLPPEVRRQLEAQLRR
mgnify:CR=1 FL=1